MVDYVVEWNEQSEGKFANSLKQANVSGALS